jgi:hypothetical protein
MDEEWSISMKKVKLDDILAIRKRVFEKKTPKLAFLKEKKLQTSNISPLKKTLSIR